MASYICIFQKMSYTWFGTTFRSSPMLYKTDSHVYRELSYLQIIKLRKKPEMK